MAAKSCCFHLIQFILFIFNLLFFLIGFVLLGLGVWFIIEGTFRVPIFQLADSASQFQTFLLLPPVMVIVGLTLIVLAAVGGGSSLADSPCLIFSYFLLLSAVALFMLVGLLGGAVNKETVRDRADMALSDCVARYNSNASCRLFVDLVQIQFQCCGYQMGTLWNGRTPDTCPSDSSLRINIPIGTGIGFSGTSKPCKEPFREAVEQSFSLYAVVFIMGFAVFCAIGIAASFTLFCCMRRSRYDGYSSANYY